MLFFNSVMCGDMSTATITPTAINDINWLQAGGAYFDDIYITRNITYTPTTIIPQTWDKDTIFHAKFNGNLSAGNVDFRYKDVEGGYIIIKRRRTDGFHWITIKACLIVSLEDTKIGFIDYTAAPGVEYEYALVPIINGTEYRYYPATITLVLPV